MYRRAWYDYCVINPSGRADKFYPEDQFGETIIKLNKEKFHPSANAKTDQFFEEVVALNQLSLWKSKSVMARVTGSTDHGNRHGLVNVNFDIKVVVDILVQEKPFEEHPKGRGSGVNGETEHADLFSKGSAKIASGIPLKNYKSRARENWAQHDVARSKAHGPDEQVDELFGNDADDMDEHDTYVSDEVDND